MAENVKIEKKEEKKNRVVEFILSEHKLENYLLLFLGIFAIELGVIILRGLADTSKALLIIPDTAWLIGGAVKTKIFSWILVALGVISIILVATSFYRPSFDEIRNIKGLKKKEFFWNVVKVICFSVVLALFFVLADYVIEIIMKAINNLF